MTCLQIEQPMEEINSDSIICALNAVKDQKSEATVCLSHVNGDGTGGPLLQRVVGQDKGPKALSTMQEQH